MALTTEQEKLKEAALAATPGKWSRQTGYFVVAETDHGSLVVAQTNNSSWPGRNADFIALANPAAILAILAQLEQVQGWCDLATSKPPEGVQVLIALDTGNVVTGFRFSAGWHWDETDCEADADATATHYQPLPPPPEAA